MVNEKYGNFDSTEYASAISFKLLAIPSNKNMSFDIDRLAAPTGTSVNLNYFDQTRKF